VTFAFEPWGRFRRRAQRAVMQEWRDAMLPSPAGATMIAYGNGRSYGDVAQNAAGRIVGTHRLSRFIAFDRERGMLEAEAGVLLADIHALTLAQGWYLPVVPGTQHVSLGGAVANDVHGKNHHRHGTFAEHVTRLELLRSDGTRLACSRDVNADWFRATVGGLGLTGLVTTVAVQMRRIGSDAVEAQTVACGSVDEFCALCDDSDPTHEYTVAWFDCFSCRDGRFDGLFMRANHAPAAQAGNGLARDTIAGTPTRDGRARRSVPVVPPFGLLHPVPMRAFNRAYHRQGARRHGKVARVALVEFLYPLDSIGHWNRLYGPHGFLQLQCVIPAPAAHDGIARLLGRIAASRQGTFLAVLKRFADRPACGVLSFARPGITLALDFPFRGEGTLALFQELHAIVRDHGGAIYPAKDAVMTAETFAAGFPDWQRMLAYKDPAFGSDFWHRVTAGAPVP